MMTIEAVSTFYMTLFNTVGYSQINMNKATTYHIYLINTQYVTTLGCHIQDFLYDIYSYLYILYTVNRQYILGFNLTCFYLPDSNT